MGKGPQINRAGLTISSKLFFRVTLEYPAFEPYALPIPYVASTGGSVFGTSSSGFLYSVNGAGFCSFLTFTATTPTSATVVADPVTPGASNLVYRINADTITSIKFVNGFGGGTTTLSIGTGVKGAVISFDGRTGFVTSVVPLASKRNAGKRT